MTKNISRTNRICRMYKNLKITFSPIVNVFSNILYQWYNIREYSQIVIQANNIITICFCHEVINSPFNTFCIINVTTRIVLNKLINPGLVVINYEHSNHVISEYGP